METHKIAHGTNLFGATSITTEDNQFPGIDVEEIMYRLRGTQKVEEKARLMSLRSKAAIEVLEGLQAVRSNRVFPYCCWLGLLQWLNSNPWHAQRPRALKVLVDLATSSNELPSGLFIQGIQLHSHLPDSFGAYADVFRGTYQGHPVAVKRLRINESGKEKDVIHRVSYYAHDTE
jgi:hypothetical protein